MLKRRLLSGLVVTQIEGAGFTVGLAQAPKNCAWDGQPNKTDSTFRPYSVVTPMSSGSYTGPIDASIYDWQIPYAVSNFGVQPEQTEFLADAVRAIFILMKKQSLILGDETYKVQQVKIDSIGALQRVDTTDPSYWGQTDSYSLWLSKEI